MRALAALVGFALSIWLLSNCQSIIGVKDYTYTAINPECGPYCDLAQQRCPGSMGAYSSIYSTRDSCTAVCNHIDPGQTLMANTLGCRESLLNGGEDCPKAGPGGGGQCGSDCEAYCSLYSRICEAQFKDEFGADSSAVCADACSALTEADGYNLARDATGATLQCRLNHLSTAAIDPGDCPNAKLRPTDKCFDPLGSDTFCSNFCTYASKACPGALAVYENQTQCLAVCKALPAGNDKNDISQNTMVCRAYHISNALLISRVVHCSHLGPGGDGHCGLDDATSGTTGNCASYCILLEKACSEKFTDAAQCQQNCGLLSGARHDSGYTVSSLPDAGTGSGAMRGTLQCRLLHLARALEHPGTNHDADCESAIGMGECAMAAP